LIKAITILLGVAGVISIIIHEAREPPEYLGDAFRSSLDKDSGRLLIYTAVRVLTKNNKNTFRIPAMEFF